MSTLNKFCISSPLVLPLNYIYDHLSVNTFKSYKKEPASFNWNGLSGNIKLCLSHNYLTGCVEHFACELIQVNTCSNLYTVILLSSWSFVSNALPPQYSPLLWVYVLILVQQLLLHHRTKGLGFRIVRASTGCRIFSHTHSLCTRLCDLQNASSHQAQSYRHTGTAFPNRGEGSHPSLFEIFRYSLLIEQHKCYSELISSCSTSLGYSVTLCWEIWISRIPRSGFS